MNTRDYTILVVDDEDDILEFVSYNLKREGYTIRTANNGKKALDLAIKLKPDLLLLDVMMPEMDGIEVCETIRRTEEINNILIAMFTARGESYSQIAGFDAGADDYIVKPIRPKVLSSRIKALLKRSGNKQLERKTSDDSIRCFENLLIDIEKHQVSVAGEQLDLPKKEFMLLTLLTSKPAKVFTRTEIYKHIWGGEVFVGDRTIDVYIRKLREKIGIERITTIKSVGYRFEA